MRAQKKRATNRFVARLAVVRPAAPLFASLAAAA
jgi:hypothetical protein